LRTSRFVLTATLVSYPIDAGPSLTEYFSQYFFQPVLGGENLRIFAWGTTTLLMCKVGDLFPRRMLLQLHSYCGEDSRGPACDTHPPPYWGTQPPI